MKSTYNDDNFKTKTSKEQKNTEDSCMKYYYGYRINQKEKFNK
jgi:hypothetical protein